MKLLKTKASAAALGVSLSGAMLASPAAAQGTGAVDGGASVGVSAAPDVQAPTLEPNPKLEHR